MLDTNIIDKALEHAKQLAPKESCGLVIEINEVQVYVPCTNISNILNTFIIDPLDYAKCEDTGKVVCVVHSHYGIPPEPSQADLVGCERSNLPWLIVNQPAGTYKLIYPTGYIAPLKHRKFVTGIFDCFSLVQDYYRQKLNIEMADHPRDDCWWERGEDLIEQNIANWNFYSVPLEALEVHDVILMQCGSSQINHMGIYIGEGRMLHHVTNQLSKEDLFGGYWLKCARFAARYKVKK